MEVVSSLDSLIYSNLEKAALSAAKAASSAILKYAPCGQIFSIKSDGSPITEADKASHKIILSHLSSTSLPIVSEEDEVIDFRIHSHYWLVDPIDGTKDFISGNGEYTVSIGLISNGYPILGVISAPSKDEIYFSRNRCSVFLDKDGIQERIDSDRIKSNFLRMAVSRFHSSSQAQIFAEINSVRQIIQIGSTLKYIKMVQGEVDVYPRYVGTSEWDTAGAQAILEAAGGSVIDLATQKRLSYGKPKRRNGAFVAFRGPYELADFIF